ncbi:MAG: hypothetical protein NE330_05170 [Lentisphaeraceae bacterium]|nr:hypothetical protein [Lentisphaeraceae bacterium]
MFSYFLDSLLPLFIGCICFFAPHLLTKKNLDLSENEALKGRFNKIGILAFVVALVMMTVSMSVARESFLGKLVKESTKSLPQKLDERTTLVNVSYKGNTITYTYELTGFENIKGDIEQVEKELKESAVEYLRKFPKRQAFLKNRVSIKNIYQDSNKSMLLEYQIYPKDYRN